MKPIVVVAGWMRSGSSMMMKCLEAGGIPVCYTPDSAEYELNKEDYRLHVNPELYEGKAVKSMRVGPERMYPWPGGYRVLFMDRPSREQQASWYKKANAYVVLETIEYQTELSLKLAANRRDAEVMVVSYHETLADPVGMMRRVKDFIGPEFDFDPVKAAAIVDPNQRHEFNIEDQMGVQPIAEADPRWWRPSEAAEAVKSRQGVHG